MTMKLKFNFAPTSQLKKKLSNVFSRVKANFSVKEHLDRELNYYPDNPISLSRFSLLTQAKHFFPDAMSNNANDILLN